MESWGRKVRVFVGAFSGFWGRVYRIPAPIFRQKRGFSTIPLQRGVGVRYTDLVGGWSRIRIYKMGSVMETVLHGY
jgi:hypothetical protein